MASRENVEEKLRELIARLDASREGARSLQDSLPEPRVLTVRLPDLEADYWTTLAAGRMDELHQGKPERADIRVTVASDDLVALVDGDRHLFPAYLAGQVRIEASVADLLRLRRLL